MSAPPLTTCPSCKAETAKRQVSGGTGFILRGGGWYADGYGSKKPESATPAKTAATPAKPDAAPSTTDSTATKTESAPAKTEAAPAKSDKATTGS